MDDSTILEFPILMRLEVNNTDAQNTAHPQMTITSDNRTYTASDILATIKRLLHLACLKTIKKHTVIAANPQSIINRVVGKRSYEFSQSDIFLWQIQRGYFLRRFHIKQTNATTPRTNP